VGFHQEVRCVDLDDRAWTCTLIAESFHVWARLASHDPGTL
jgi:hypothetical protein